MCRVQLLYIYWGGFPERLPALLFLDAHSLVISSRLFVHLLFRLRLSLRSVTAIPPYGSPFACLAAAKTMHTYFLG
ncbi:hypothetical protein [Geobacillus sp. TFV-3]|uniref:hypothetical protein n=1 Tax=Geobacillus sp. TFV-3 TaxID=1897059 RepID=UPI00135CA48E|nr:hypothetical protein [Geobacillus sp. TFV-3]